MGDMSAESLWLGFFRKAGITPGFDTKYALIFDENRIKVDMLKDITKKCLNDMGITAMGDIIAILKQAKNAQEESETQGNDVPQPSTAQLFSPQETSLPDSSVPSVIIDPSIFSSLPRESNVSITSEGRRKLHIDMISQSLESMLKNTCNNSFRRECFKALKSTSSEVAVTHFKLLLQNLFEEIPEDTTPEEDSEEASGVMESSEISTVDSSSTNNSMLQQSNETSTVQNGNESQLLENEEIQVFVNPLSLLK